MTSIILNQVSIKALLIAVGYFLYKKSLLTRLCSKEIGSMLVMVIIPSVIIRSLLVEYGKEKLNLLLMSTLISIVFFIISITISNLFFKKDSVVNFGSSFCNSGFIGFPLAQNELEKTRLRTVYLEHHVSMTIILTLSSLE